MKRIFVYAGPLFFLLLTLNQVRHYGSRWEFGRMGMPVTIASADGTKIDPLTQTLARSGAEEGAMLGLLLYMGVCIVGAFLLMRDTAKKRHAIECWQSARAHHELHKLRS
jgi:hypothetical protein